MPKENRIDWNTIRAEYIAGGTSYRKLAAKHGVPQSNLMRRASAERWSEQREEARNRAIAKQIQKTADAAADNAATAQRIKAKLLARLEQEIDNMPGGHLGTATYQQTERVEHDKKTGKPIKKRSGIEYKLREFAAAYKDLTADMPQEQGRGNELLQSLFELESRRRDDGD